MKVIIRTDKSDVACDVCGRTLLRGERAEEFVAGGAPRTVCELCTSRAQHGGWERMDLANSDPASGMRRMRREGRRGGSLLERFRTGRKRRQEDEVPDLGIAGEERRSRVSAVRRTSEPQESGMDYSSSSRLQHEYGALTDAQYAEIDRVNEHEYASQTGHDGFETRREPLSERSQDYLEDTKDSYLGRSQSYIEPTENSYRDHLLRAIPLAPEQKLQFALDLFNQSTHTRKIAGVARSLGEPQVCVHLCGDQSDLALITVMWELSWYRFAVELSERKGAGVICDGQGAELHELATEERVANAVADEQGRLHLTS